MKWLAPLWCLHRYPSAPGTFKGGNESSEKDGEKRREKKRREKKKEKLVERQEGKRGVEEGRKKETAESS